MYTRSANSGVPFNTFTSSAVTPRSITSVRKESILKPTSNKIGPYAPDLSRPPSAASPFWWHTPQTNAGHDKSPALVPVPHPGGSKKAASKDESNSEKGESHAGTDNPMLDFDEFDEEALPRERPEEDKSSSVNQFRTTFYEKEPGGIITIEVLKEILMAMHGDLSEDQVMRAIHRVVGEGAARDSKVHYDRAVEIFNILSTYDEDHSEMEERSKNCLVRWAESLSESRATNVLLFIVVTVSFLGAYLVAALAIALMLSVSSTTLNQHLQEDLGTVRDVLDVFATDIFQQDVEKRMSDISSMIAIVAADVGYRGMVESYKDNLLQTAMSMAVALNAWWECQPDHAFEDVAKVMSVWTARTVQNSGGTAASVVESINTMLPPGHEVLLGQWMDTTKNSVEIMTKFKFAADCQGDCNPSPMIGQSSPLFAALSGDSGARQTLDYRSKSVLAGYTSTIGGMGVEYKADMDVVMDGKHEWWKKFFGEKNADLQDSHDFIVGALQADGTIELLAKPISCDDSCTQQLIQPDSPLGRSLRQETGVVETIGRSGLPILAAYTPIGTTNMGLVVEVLKEEFVPDTLAHIATLLDTINKNHLAGTEEVELYVRSNATTITHLTQYKFATQCPGGKCVIPDYVTAAINNCSSGVVHTTDYCGHSVVAGYFCLNDFDAVVSMKVDVKELQDESLREVVDAIDQRNELDTDNSCEFLVAAPQPGLKPSDVKNFSDVRVVTKIKYPESCINPDCHYDRVDVLTSIQNDPDKVPGTIHCLDYRTMPIVASMEFDALIGGGIGLAEEIDYTEYIAPVMQTTTNVLVFTTAVTISCTLFLVLLTKKMMRSMIAASEEGKQAIEVEKQRFSDLVVSMYPAYVVPRLLAGERHIVCQVPHAAVFFSDIYEFTTASNAMRSEELVEFMCYTYGLMDDVAERFGVYKVKTVGDAYLAISGLPDPTGKSSTSTSCLDLLRFASCVAQIFSHKFHHPEKGKVLKLISGAMSWKRKRRRQQTTSTGDTTTVVTSTVGRRSTNKTVSLTEGGAAPSTVSGSRGDGTDTILSRDSKGPLGNGMAADIQCAMSYGLATGTVIAGVLQGKSPMFDIWGKAVNLASRMESTGQPGRIQVSENFYRKVAAVEGQPFSFDTGHTTYCKGFGAMKSYFVLTSSEPPPKDLMIQLGLKTRYGPFYFDNILTRLQPGNDDAQKKEATVSEGASQVSSNSLNHHGDAQANQDTPTAMAMLDYDDM